MKYTEIKGTDLKLSAVTLGTWVFGGESWGSADEKDCLDAVAAALDSGINTIDTAPIYGHGISEEIVGKAIVHKRSQVVLATKCGLIAKNGRIDIDLSPGSITQEIDASLRRLQTDYIDLYQCHWPDPNTPLEETIKTMDRLKQQGKIRHIGLSNYGPEDIAKAAQITKISTLQSHYSLLERALEKSALPFCKTEHVGVLTYGPLGGGILSGKYKSPAKFKGRDARNILYKFYQGEQYKKVNDLLSIFKEIDRPFNQIAINWVRQQEGVTAAIVGSRNAGQAKANAQAVEWELTPQQLGRLSAFKF